MTQLIAHASTLVLVIGILAFIVSVIIQVIKGVALFKNVPTDLVVVILSIVLTVLTYFAYISYVSMAFLWYTLFAAIILGFIVALVAMQGWTKVVSIGKSFIKTDVKDILSTDEAATTTTKEVDQ